jgi:hypothetical protein
MDGSDPDGPPAFTVSTVVRREDNVDWLGSPRSNVSLSGHGKVATREYSTLFRKEEPLRIVS